MIIDNVFFSSDLSAVQPIYAFVEDNYDLARPVSLFVWKYGKQRIFILPIWVSGGHNKINSYTYRDVYNWRPKKRINRKGEIQLLVREGQVF